MGIITYKSRRDFISIINEHSFKRCAELGVATGDFSSVLAKSKLTELVLVDKWNDHHNEAEQLVVIKRFAKDSRIKIFHELFSKAVNRFPDEYFDFIYIDGYAHTGQDSGLTLALWWPKVRIGGFFGGHDYHMRFKPTINVVDEFCKKYDKELYTTEEDTFPSWYVFK